jgi:hypothetical protein
MFKCSSGVCGRSINRPLTVEARNTSQACPCAICGGHKLQWDGFFPYSCVPLSLSTHQRFTLILIKALLLPQRQTAEAWDLHKKQCSLGNWGTLLRKVLLTFRLLMVNEGTICHKHLRSSIWSAVTVVCSSVFVTFALSDGIFSCVVAKVD